jgi:DNA (cytosine-5)-methyltransferase 1
MTAPLKVLSLFAGIGGFDLGLERTGGFKTVAFCEIEPFAQSILRKHWPEVPIYDDVRSLTGARVLRDTGLAEIDIICGGFPCQDISLAGSGAGIEGERSGLWTEFARLISELRPRFALVENVAALLNRGMGRVLGDLAEIGYDAEWHCIPAYYAGPPQPRDRVWIVAYDPSWIEQSRRTSGDIVGLQSLVLREGWPANDYADQPNIPGVAWRVPNRFHRISALGNAVVPQIPELIGKAILAAEGAAQ